MTYDVVDINKQIINNKEEFIFECEDKHQRQYKKVLNMINDRLPKLRIVCVAGPSSSGKTTFSKNLHGLLSKANIGNAMISLDDYFFNKEDLIPGPDGTIDFESVDCVDRKTFSKDLKSIISGIPTKVPRYNFNTGKREEDFREILLGERGVVFVEGIHALNYDALFSHEDRDKMFGVFISPEDDYRIGNEVFANYTTRLLRRIVRDVYYRNSSLMNTMDMWASVRNGEFKYILPYKKNSDVTFNSSLAYEISVLKDDFMDKYDLLQDEEKKIVNQDINTDHVNAFLSLSDDEVPKHSLLKEFILT